MLENKFNEKLDLKKEKKMGSIFVISAGDIPWQTSWNIF